VSGPNGETLILLPGRPRGARLVQCQQCELIGWVAPDDPQPDDPGEHCGIPARWLDEPEA
jgi:hypothetical protein